MQELIDLPGFVSITQGAATLRSLYQRRSAKIDPTLLSEFARLCFTGNIRAVRDAVESANAPDILGHETPFQYGYALLTVHGSYRVRGGPPATDHAATLKYLLECGAPPDIPDIVGYTALHHACIVNPRADLARILLEAGADPNYQDRFGSVPLMGAFQNDAVDTIDVLMEYGARLDIEDANGDTPDEFFIKAGPYVTAAVQKWKRKRAGENQPLDEGGCAACGKQDTTLKFCGKCGAAWYCSKECQRSDWQQHKLTCIGFNRDTTVTLRPFYQDIGPIIPTADMHRMMYGYPVAKQSKRSMRSMHVPHIRPGETKKLIIKVQVPFDMDTGAPQAAELGDLMIFDRKRSLVCRIRREDDEEGYLRISRVVRQKGVCGAKAYFPAEMTRPDKLVVKVSEVLAEQNF
ncbi:ankyrin [Lenzites betulinus]|nr:ankyrin [Lenzites betulinus]